MKSKRFTARENVLMVILAAALIVALYYLLVFKPTEEAMNAAKEELDDAAGLMMIEEARAGQILRMRTALEKVADTEEIYTITPTFDNFKNLLDELSKVLSAADSYKLYFVDPVVEDGIAKRELQLILYSDNYYSASNIIRELYSGPYRCDITAFKLSPTESNANDLTASAVSTALSIIYYEISK